MTLPAGAQIGIRAWDVDETVRRDASLESSCTLNDCVQNTAIATPYQIVGNNSDESCLSAYGQAIRTAIDPQGLLVTTTCVSLKSSKTAKHVERRCTLMFTDKAWTPARSLPASPRLVTSSTPCRRCQASQLGSQKHGFSIIFNKPIIYEHCQRLVIVSASAWMVPQGDLVRRQLLTSAHIPQRGQQLQNLQSRESGLPMTQYWLYLTAFRSTGLSWGGVIGGLSLVFAVAGVVFFTKRRKYRPLPQGGGSYSSYIGSSVTRDEESRGR